MLITGDNSYYDFFNFFANEAGITSENLLNDLPNEEKQKMIDSMIALSEKNKGGTRRLRRKRRKSRRR